MPSLPLTGIPTPSWTQTAFREMRREKRRDKVEHWKNLRASESRPARIQKAVPLVRLFSSSLCPSATHAHTSPTKSLTSNIHLPPLSFLFFFFFFFFFPSSVVAHLLSSLLLFSLSVLAPPPPLLHLNPTSVHTLH
jgi:hypothetical protein